MPVRRFPIRMITVGLVTATAGWTVTDHARIGWAIAGLGATIVIAALWRRLRRQQSGTGHIGRWERRSRRHAGTASWWDIFTTSSAWAMRRKATVLRPSLRDMSRWRRRRAPVLSYATPLCRAGVQRVWTSCEESTLRVGTPGTGKTAELACRVIDAPGGVVVTSTAADLYELTAPLRRRCGAVQVFNPGGIGGIPSTLRWSPLTGCADPAVAVRRAVDLMGPGTGSAEGERWDIQGRRVLAVLLHAAALGGYRVADVAAWVANPDANRQLILDALLESPQAAEMCRAAAQTITMTTRTRDGVMLAIVPAVAWVTQPTAAACGDPDPRQPQFSIGELTGLAGSLYLLGDDDGTMAPLVGALVAEIAQQARTVAAVRPGGRLDPALTFCLDEIALVCPTPLDRWMAELRKRSIVIHAACQGLGQLRQRWGDNGASMILNSAAAVLVFGGCKDASDLAAFGQLAGERDEPVVTHDPDGKVMSSTIRRVPVIPPAMLAGLGNHRALLVRRGMPVTLVWTPVAWRRRDVRRRAKVETRTARAVARALTRAARAVARRGRPQPSPVTEPVHP